MSDFTFIIPANEADLLRTPVSDEYTVVSVSQKVDIPKDLANCRVSLREEGPEFILNAFDTYYSVLHHADSLNRTVIYRAYEDLHKGTNELNKALGFLFEDKECLNDEIKRKYVNILKMLLYLYTRIVLKIEKCNVAKKEQQISLTKGRGKKKSSSDDNDFLVDKKNVLLVLNNIIRREISLFWEPEVIEESLINLVSGICYEFLQNPEIKKEKEELSELFNVLGYLLKAYNHGTTFIVRLTQLIKIYEHLTQCVPNGIKQLVEDFNFKGLLHELIVELTEWQVDNGTQDSPGSRHCAAVLTSLAMLLPNLMMPEVVSLNIYLYHEPASLRMSVLNVMVEVIVSNLTDHEIDDEKKKFRDELMNIILEHASDNSVLVRAKVFQQLARMQKEMAIPHKMQQEVLETAVEHLCDKGPLARKCAANCVTTFLCYNIFSSHLSLSSVKKVLEEKKLQFTTLKEQCSDTRVSDLMELQAQWDSIVEPLTKEVEKLDEDKENIDEEPNQIPLEHVPDIIRNYLQNEQYKEAIQVLKKVAKDNDFLDRFKEKTINNKVEFYMIAFYNLFFDITKIMDQIKNQEFPNISIEDYNKLEGLVGEVDFWKNCESFLSTIDSAIDIMVELLETTSISDMHEAIAFFTAAYQFNIDRASDGILAMLRMMQRKEQERKDAIIDSFKKIYLATDTENIADHIAIIINRLIRLIRTIPVLNLADFEEIVSDWVAKGTLDNGCINHLWAILVERVIAPEDDQIAAAVLLKMAALGRKKIICSNINLVTSIAFGDRGKKNLQFMNACCELLSVAHEKVDIISENPPFKIDYDDQCFNDLLVILNELFFKPVKFYHKALYGGINFVYKLSSKPDHFAEQLLNSIVPKLYKKQTDEPDYSVPHYILIRLCEMGGYIALKQLEYMDDTIYKELKRRECIKNEHKKKKLTNKSRKSMTAITNSTTKDETILEGASAEDEDAEFILNILEKDIVTGSGYLAKMAPLIIKICERPDMFDTPELQFAAVTALSRYMLVSSEFCQNHIRLLFTILERNKYHGIKTTILMHISDLLTRFPNLIDPWVDKIFQNLKDPLPEARQVAFFAISSMILRDMIRAHSHIPKMAIGLADPDLSSMSKTFFQKLSHKENSLYNALPDIFAHFIEEKIGDDESLRSSMKILFDMVENAKHIENVVGRFCSKFRLTEDNQQHRHISYCLTLIQYNDKALRRLIEDFPLYKDLVHDEELYANFRTIIQNCSKQVVGKPDLKPLATELENLINSVFEINEEGSRRPPLRIQKSTKKAPPKKRGRKKKSRRSSSTDCSSSD